MDAKIIHCFFFTGELYCSGTSKELCERLGLTKAAVNSGRIRESLVQSKYYFSHDRDFIPPKKNLDHNPITQSSSQHGDMTKYSDIDHRIDGDHNY